ncbi:MAG: hypothetical protein RL662_714 [Bacteroidota bacterium]
MKHLQIINYTLPLHRIREIKTLNKALNSTTLKTHGPFVYRLGRKIFILERGVRLPYGLLI